MSKSKLFYQKYGLVLAVTISLFLSATITYIGPGYRGVCVNLLAKEDVQDVSLSTGIHLLAPWKKVWKFPTFEQNLSWANFSFQTCEGLASNVDIGITFAVNPEAVPKLFRKYRSGINEISQKFMLNYLRDAITVAASSRSIEDMYGRGKEQFLFDVQTTVKDKLGPLGINVSRVYLVDAFRFPQSVVKALNLKIEAAQRAEQRENELREAEAEARKQMAEAHGRSESLKEVSTAEAESIRIKAVMQSEANSMVNKTLTKELINYRAIEQWNGVLPETVAGDGINIFKGLK